MMNCILNMWFYSYASVLMEHNGLQIRVVPMIKRKTDGNKIK